MPLSVLYRIPCREEPQSRSKTGCAKCYAGTLKNIASRLLPLKLCRDDGAAPEAGNIVPADMRICRSCFQQLMSRLRVNQCPLTKTAKKLFREKCPLLTEATWPQRERWYCMAEGRAVVTSTGMQTELGKMPACCSKSP